MRREQGYNRLTSDEQYTPYGDVKVKAHVVKAESFEIVLYDHYDAQKSGGPLITHQLAETYGYCVTRYSFVCPIHRDP